MSEKSAKPTGKRIRLRRPPPDVESPLVTVPVAAAIANVSERTVNTWLSNGTLPRVRLPGLKRAVRIERRQLLEMIAESAKQAQVVEQPR